MEVNDKPAPKKPRVSRKQVKEKGSVYEREIAEYFNEHVEGISARRALLSGGGRNDGGMDVEGIDFLHPELKRTETLRLHESVAQAVKAAGKEGKGNFPTVITRRNRQSTGESLVTMRLDDFIDIYRWYRAHKLRLTQ